MIHVNIRKGLIFCGICSPLLYIITDIIAGNLYKDYSFNEQAVSELFAIGAPTSHIVVPLFTICSMLLSVFALGIWLSCKNNYYMRILAIMILGNAVNCLILWNFFPMHMRSVQTTFTDTMHTILAINPFISVSILLGIIVYKNWFRYYSLVTVILLLISAVISFSYISPLLAHQPTPWLGFTERTSIYAHQLWHAVLSVMLANESDSMAMVSVTDKSRMFSKEVSK